MGELKPALPLGDSTVLEQCIGLFKECGIDDIIVVTGHRADETGSIAERAGARIAHNTAYGSGMYSSIQAGVRLISGQSKGFFLLPVDIPLVRQGTIRLLSRAFEASPARILYPLFDSQRGHPPLIERHLAAIIGAIAPESGGLRTLLARVEQEQPHLVRSVPVADAHILVDMDTPDAFIDCRRRYLRRDFPSMDECKAILEHIHPMPEKGLAHGCMVAEVAAALCQALNQASEDTLDCELCRVCGWLHDIAKGRQEHELEGARWLRDLGFPVAASIIAAHKDLNWQPAMPMREREIVHLADKLVHGARLVPVQARFEEKLNLYRNNPKAIQAIRSRYVTALHLAATVEAATGHSLKSIVLHAADACNP